MTTIWHHLLKFLLLETTFGTISIISYGPQTLSSELLLVCLIPSFSGPAMWSRNSFSPLTECTASGFCQVVLLDNFSFLSNSSGIYAKINPLEESENGVKWTCYHNNENVTYIVSLLKLTSVRLDPSEDFELNESESKVFKCDAKSVPLANITWSIDGSVWSNSTLDTRFSYLFYVGNRPDHNRLLYCTAKAGQLTVLSSKVKISIIYAPAMIPNVEVNPEGGIIAGNNVTLKCSTWGGNPLPVLSWNCSSGLEQNNTAGNQSSYSVTFLVNKADNNKICACTATHPVGTAYLPVVYHRLVVFYAPDDNLSIVQNPTKAVAQKSVKLTCNVSGGNPLAILAWNCSGMTTNDTAGNTASYSVEFTAHKADNNKVCTCSANHTIIMSYKPKLQYTLTVFFPPGNPSLYFFPTQPLLEGELAQVDCNATLGNPPESFYEWFLNGKLQPAQNTNIFVFRNVTKDVNLLPLHCNIRNNFTDQENITRQSKAEILNVNYYPLFTMSVHTVTVNETGTINQTCNAVGNPQPDVQWFLKNLPMSPRNRNRTTLYLEFINGSNAGIYECKANASSHHGELQRSFLLEIIVNFSQSKPASEDLHLYQTSGGGLSGVKLAEILIRMLLEIAIMFV